LKTRRFAIVNAILAATLLGLFWASRTAPAEGASGDYLKGLNLSFKDWTSREQQLTSQERKLLLPDTVLLQQFRSQDGAEEVGIAVIAGHRKQTVHTPAFCMAGGGWNTISEKDLQIPIGSEGVEATRAVMESEGHRILVTYFFTDGALSLRSLPAFQFQQFLQRLRGRPTSGALVRVLVPIASDRARAERLSDEFASAALPSVLQKMRKAHPSNR
jgi:EpsI family protein